MATIKQKLLPPDSILSSTNITGAVTDVDDPTDNTDANYIYPTDGGSSYQVRFTFPSPGGELSGTQTFRVAIQKTDDTDTVTTGGGNPSFAVDLEESGTSIQTGVISQTLADNGNIQVFSGTWDANTAGLTNTDGSEVELFFDFYQNGGGPNARNGRLHAAEWEAQGAFGKRKILIIQ